MPIDSEAPHGRFHALRRRRRPIAMLAALGCVAAIVTACGGGGSSTTAPAEEATTAAATTAAEATATSIDTALGEMYIRPAQDTAPAGPVTFVLKNEGSAEHEFVVVKTDMQAGDLAGDNGEADETGSVGEEGSIQPGETKELTLDLEPGHYALICNLPGHYAAGMYADFTVE